MTKWAGMDQEKNFYDEIESLVDKYGLVDFFFCGVSLTGDDKHSIRIGDTTPDQANRQRYLHMVGHIQEGVFEIQSDKYERRNQREHP